MSTRHVVGEQVRALGVRGIVMLVVLVLLALTPILVSGRWDWWQAWLVAAVFVGGFIVSRWLAARRNPGILRERAESMRSGDTVEWDRLLCPLVAFGTVVILLIAGLDARFGWSTGFPPWLELVGLVLVVVGYLLGSWALIENAWFSGTVRVQAERGHAVVSSGPYAWVRHPGYLGTLITATGLPPLLGSAWAFIPAVAYCALVVLRTRLEDRFLRARLDGYTDYAERVRHRLLPGIW